MKYKLEFHPNPDCLSIHLQKRLTKSSIVCLESPEDKIKVWEGNAIVGSKEPPIFVKRLWEIDGITGITLQQYQIGLTKSLAFDWKDLLERIILSLNLELFPLDEPEQVGEPKKPSKELLRSLRQQGCDV